MSSKRTDFGQRLYLARKHAGLTQPELAKLAGMGQSTLAEAEFTAQGSSFVTAIARATGIRPEWLSEGSGDMVESVKWPFAPALLDRVIALDDLPRGIIEGRLIAAIEDAERELANAPQPSEAEKKKLAQQTVLGPSKSKRSGRKQA